MDQTLEIKTESEQNFSNVRKLPEKMSMRESKKDYFKKTPSRVWVSRPIIVQ